ncbi:MAG TPA: abortive infection family protein [Polyangiaceae bacterium]|nr:abortive infection family protein [Polyangiaceae bacterium]
MPGDIISKHLRDTFREHFVGKTLREIRIAFDAAEVDCDAGFQPECTGERRKLVEQYYHAVDFTSWADARKVLKVYAAQLQALEDLIAEYPQYELEEPKRSLATLTKVLERAGFKYETGVITYKGQVASLPTVQEAAAALDVPELHRQLARLRDAPEQDPGLAIGTAKELVETTCKTILHARGVAFDEGADIIQLVKKLREELALMPEDVPSAEKGAEIIKRVLGNLGTIAQGLGELRNLYGTGHGKAGSVKELSARHARLAVGCAATLSTFLLETHEETGVNSEGKEQDEKQQSPAGG